MALNGTQATNQLVVWTKQGQASMGVCKHSDIIILYIVDSHNPLLYFLRAMYDCELYEPPQAVCPHTLQDGHQRLRDVRSPRGVPARTNLEVAGIVCFSVFHGLTSPAEQEQKQGFHSPAER